MEEEGTEAAVGAVAAMEAGVEVVVEGTAPATTAASRVTCPVTAPSLARVVVAEDAVVEVLENSVLSSDDSLLIGMHLGGGYGGGGGGDRSCYNCGQSGHISRDCTEPRQGGGGGRSGGNSSHFT